MTSARAWRWSALLALLPLLVLAAPKAPESECLKLVQLPLGLSFTSNCDSRRLTQIATDPRRIPDSDWRSRPAYFLAGMVAAPAAAVVALPLWDMLLAGRVVAPGIDLQRFALVLPYHLAFVALNWAVLALTIRLVADLVGRDRRDLWVPTGVLLSLCEMSRAFFLTPHTQMFNLLVPVLLLWLVERGPAALAMAPRRLALVGLGLGGLVLFYGLAMLAGPAAILGMLWWGHRLRALPGLRLAARQSAILGGAFILPSLSWIAFTTLGLGTAPSAEISAHRQLVWPLDAWRAGTLGDAATSSLLTYAQMSALAVQDLAPVAALLAAVAIAAQGTAALADRRAIVAALASIAVFAFFYFVHWYDERLAMPPLVPLLCLPAILAAANAARSAPAILWCAAVAALAWTFISPPSF